MWQHEQLQEENRLLLKKGSFTYETSFVMFFLFPHTVYLNRQNAKYMTCSNGAHSMVWYM